MKKFKRNVPKGVISRPNYGIGNAIKSALEQLKLMFDGRRGTPPITLSIWDLHILVLERGFDVDIDYIRTFINRKDKDFEYRFIKQYPDNIYLELQN